MELSTIIVSWNTKQLLKNCLQSLLHELKDIESEVFVVDNNSEDNSADMVANEFPQVKLIRNDTNRGFAAANNQVLAQAQGKYILLLNPDTEIFPNAIKNLIGFLNTNDKAYVVAPQLINSDGSIQRSCRSFPTFLAMLYELIGLSRLFPNHKLFGHYKMLEFDHNHERQVDQPEGACLLIRRSVIERIGMLDEGYFMLFEEVDWCYRIKQAGLEIWFTPKAKVKHHYGQAIKQVKIKMILSSHRGLYRFWSKHYRQGKWYLDWLVYSGLMLLAYIRIISYWLKNTCSKA
jgi:GT2 family glycosyltransferase